MFKEMKARKWVRKIIKKNNATQAPVCPSHYIHPTDKTALEALKKIPLFDKLCGKLIDMSWELNYAIENMAGNIHITEKQLPHIYDMVQSICKKLGIAMPELYLTLDRSPNASTYGNEDHHFIIIHSGLLECLDEDEVYSVLAHECGHIACQHVLYHTVGRLVLSGGEAGLVKLNTIFNSTLIGSLLTQAALSSLEVAFRHWNRCSELSADRIAVLCCEDAQPVIKTMMRLAGGTSAIPYEVDQQLFLEQALAYKEHTTEKKGRKILEFLTINHLSHPLLAVRAFEANEFAKSPDFSAFLNPINTGISNTHNELPCPATDEQPV